MLNLMSIRYPADLPITARRQEIVAAIRGHQVLDLATETCSEGSQRDRHFILLYFIGKLDRGLNEASERGWTVVSMKDDWKAIYPMALAD